MTRCDPPHYPVDVYKRQAITVPANVSGILPLDSKLKGMVVLNIGKTPVSYTHLDVYKRQG